MSKQVATFFALFAVIFSFGQSNFKKNTVYVEAGGNGLFGSISYERQLMQAPGLGARIGVGVYAEYGSWVTIPVGIDYLFPLKSPNAFIDAGLGITWTSHDEKTGKGLYFVNYVPSLGYRKNAPNNLMWRVSVTPV